MESLEREDIRSLLKDVRDKIRSLEKMAEEQKILSLNILVEASRTGENGKGLKIVAKQMRELTENVSKIYGAILEDIDSL